MKVLIYALLITLLLGVSKQESIEFTFTGENLDGTPDPIVIYPGLFTEFYAVATQNITKKFIYAYVNFALSPQGISLKFDDTIQRQLRFHDTNRMLLKVGLDCGAQITDDMVGKEYTVNFRLDQLENDKLKEQIDPKNLFGSGNFNKFGVDDIKVKGSFKVKIGGKKAVINLSMMQSEISVGSYSFLKSAKRFKPIDDMYVDCTPAGEGYEEDGIYCELNLPRSSPDNYRYLVGYEYYDTWNNLEAKFGSHPEHEFKTSKTYTFNLQPQSQCFQFEPSSFTFTVDPKKELPVIGNQQKKEIVKSLKVLQADVASSVKFSFNLPVAPARVDCGATVEPPFVDYYIWDHGSSEDGNLLYYTNFYNTTGEVKIDILTPRAGKNEEFKVKCYVRNTKETYDYSDTVYFVLGRYFTSNYPYKLETTFPAYIPEKAVHFVFKENLDWDLGMEALGKLAMFVLEKMMAGNPDAKSSSDNGCITTFGQFSDQKSFYFKMEWNLICNSAFKGNAKELFLEAMKGIETNDQIQAITGMKQYNLNNRWYDTNEDFTKPEEFGISLALCNKTYVSFRLNNPFDVPKYIYYDINYEYPFLLEAKPGATFSGLETLDPQSRKDIGRDVVTGIEEKLFSLTIGVIPQNESATVYGDPYIAATHMLVRDTLPRNTPKKDDDLIANEVNCTADRNHIECIKSKEREFIDYLSAEDSTIQSFYSMTQGFTKMLRREDRNFYVEQQLKLAEGKEVEDNIDFLYKSFKGSKLVSVINCHKEGDYQDCKNLKKGYLDKIFNARDWLFDCEQVVEHIKVTAKRKEDRSKSYRQGLVAYLLFLTNMAKSPEAFNAETTKKLVSTTQCLKDKIETFKKEYDIEDIDIDNLIPTIPSLLVDAFQYDLANGYVNTSEILYQNGGLFVTETGLKVKKMVDEAIQSKLGEVENVDLGLAYSHIIKKSNTNEATNLTFPKSDIIVKLDSASIFKDYPEGYYIEATIYYTYPLVSTIQNIISSSFVKIRLFDSNKKEIEASGLKDSSIIEVSFPSAVDKEYITYSSCYSFDSKNYNLTEDGNATVAQGSTYAVCQYDHLGDYTSGGLKKPDPPKPIPPEPKDKGGFKIIYLIIILGIIIIAAVIGFFIHMQLKKKRTVDLPTVGGQDQELLANLN